ncbi:hypothetical protein DSO57_1003639 [Entomophthora muscae]|uniref:Uncharacterized protein n=1 Tax=Entomophthora muscae TaxID=34485 RepID=A0ACC2SL29_9FUNG|nr:hypothetical protein DSO57_1003639 [Entomophthora muscae]
MALNDHMVVFGPQYLYLWLHRKASKTLSQMNPLRPSSWPRINTLLLLNIINSMCSEMHTLSNLVPINPDTLSKDGLVQELDSCGRRPATVNTKLDLSVQFPNQHTFSSFMFLKIRNSIDARCYSITDEIKEGRDSFLLSFGAKGSVCLTDHRKIPLSFIRGNHLSSLVGNFKINMSLEDSPLSEARILLKMPTKLTFSKSKSNVAVVSIKTATEKVSFNWTYQPDDSWRLTSLCHPLHTIASFRYPNTLPRAPGPILEFYLELPRGLVILFLTSVGFLVYN